MRDAETGAWRSRGKAERLSPLRRPFWVETVLDQKSQGHMNKNKTKAKLRAMWGLNLKMPTISMRGINRHPRVDTNPPPERSPCRFFLCLSFSQPSIVHRTRQSARGGPGNSTTCSMLPPGDATSPALDCTMYNVRGVFCDLANTGAVPLCTKCQHRKPRTWALASSYRPSPRRWLRSKVASAACPPCWNCPREQGGISKHIALTIALFSFRRDRSPRTAAPKCRDAEVASRWSLPPSQCRLLCPHCVHCRNLGDGRYSTRDRKYIYIQEEGKKKKRKGKC